VTLALLMEPSEGMKFTPQTRMAARLAFQQVCLRWVPLDTFAAAFNDLMGEDGGPHLELVKGDDDA
jgi:hypothetical protein